MQTRMQTCGYMWNMLGKKNELSTNLWGNEFLESFIFPRQIHVESSTYYLVELETRIRPIVKIWEILVHHHIPNK